MRAEDQKAILAIAHLAAFADVAKGPPSALPGLKWSVNCH
jgi:hypothetical protein